MPPLPVLSGREAVRALARMGWIVARRKGSHVTLVHARVSATLSVPDHGEVARGTLRSPIRAANLTVEEFIAQL
jgi:predicted RNA binding protein YcfA (HicA-like mRNA interferase family)